MNDVIIILGTGIACFILTCFAILDVARKDFESIQIKALWGFIAFIPFIGFIIYFLFGFRKGKPATTPK